MDWIIFVCFVMVATPHCSCNPSPLDELTINLNIDDTPNAKGVVGSELPHGDYQGELGYSVPGGYGNYGRYGAGRGYGNDGVYGGGRGYGDGERYGAGGGYGDGGRYGAGRGYGDGGRYGADGVIGYGGGYGKNGLMYAKNVETLSSKEKGTLLEAMKKLQASPGWTKVVSIHGDPVRQECSNEFCCVHNEEGSFLPWHRVYVELMDEAIQRYDDPFIVMPYWDWTSSKLPSIVEDARIENPKTGRRMENPFFKGYIEYQNRYTTRRVSKVTNIDTKKHLEDVLTALEEEDFLLFSLQLQFNHNDIHDYVAGDMITLERSSYDPVFFLHHSFVDLIWAVYQIINPNFAPTNEVLEQVQTPWDVTAKDTLSLVSRYNLDMNSDRIVLGGMTLAQIKEEVRSRREKDKVFAGFFLRSYFTSGRIHFNICVLDDCSYPGGDVVVFGGEREKQYVNAHPYKVDITENLERAGITDIETVGFEITSFETIDSERRPFDVFQPVRIFKEGKTGKYHYCLFLDGKHQQPPKIIAPKDYGIRIESKYGKVYSTNMASNYEQCNMGVESMEAGKEITLTPGPHYFYDDDCQPTVGTEGCIGKLNIVTQ